MKLRAENFGPLAKLDIEVKPLTILIGKNSLGKSYAAQLLYVLLCVANDFRGSKFRFPFFFEQEQRAFRRQRPSESEIIMLTEEIRNENLSDIVIIDRLSKLILQAEAESLQSFTKIWLGRVFGVEIEKLINITSTKAMIECEIFTELCFKVEICKPQQLKIELTLKEGKAKEYVEIFSSTLQKIRQMRKKKTYVEELMRLLQQRIMVTNDEISILVPWTRKYNPVAYYIPAGRAGLIESYDTVVEALFFHAAGMPTSGLSIPPLPGMANQFYGVLRSLNGEKGPLSKEITPYFLSLLNGDVKLTGARFRRTQKAARIRMIYHFRLGEDASWIELIHAASMIKELAPIYLIVQELVNPGQYLIIEEPESHLHPGAQFGLAKVFAKMANLKVNVLLTTHSPVMLRKLSHFIRKNENGSKENINPNDARIYLIKEGKKGSISHPVKISDIGTLDEIPTFDEVINDLYDEEMHLSREVEP